LIELLKEKRQAVISHAVTKGLNPHVKMKPSGIDWLGDVPEHWEIARLGRCGVLQNGLSIDGEAFGSGFPFISYSDVYQNEILPELPRGLVRTTEKDQERYDVAVGDVFFTRTSETVDDIGVASTCLASIPRATFAGFLIRFRPTANTLWPNYSTYLFRNEGVKRHFAGTMNLVTRASLSQGVLKALPICFPPRDEQRDIARYLDDRANALLHLISQAQKAIALLQERRTALISAAVTGKIDVRDFVPKGATA
jgi:type I restriction enzyme S subunit